MDKLQDNIIVKFLNEEHEKQYRDYIANNKNSFMYYSLQYRELLTTLLQDKSEYLIALDGNDIVGCMPVFYRTDSELGTVANSMPYYGGHGGPLADNDCVRRKLLAAYLQELEKKKCVAATVVGSPIEDFDWLYKEEFQPTFIDERIELMTYFPKVDKDKIADSLIGIFHYKVRNMIRKAIKNGVQIRIDNSREAIEFLYSVHTDNMLAIGGMPKAHQLFSLFPSYFKKGEDYNVYVAYLDGKKIAAMLVFYFMGTVEYYTPVIVSEFRNYQPLSLLIYYAMQDAMESGMEKWNWGGTGITQKSLYIFKSRWGTTETRYYYYTKILDKNILKIGKDLILEKFKNYYVYPFGQVS